MRSAGGSAPQPHGRVRCAGAVAVVAVPLLAACLDPIRPQVIPECPRPVLDQTEWQRAGSSFVTVLLPPGFTQTGNGLEWQRDPLKVSLSSRALGFPGSDVAPEFELTGGCRGKVSGRTVLVEFAEGFGGAGAEYHVIATWPNVITSDGVLNVFFEGRSFSDADVALLLAMVHTVEIAVPPWPGGSAQSGVGADK